MKRLLIIPLCLLLLVGFTACKKWPGDEVLPVESNNSLTISDNSSDSSSAGTEEPLSGTAAVSDSGNSQVTKKPTTTTSGQPDNKVELDWGDSADTKTNKPTTTITGAKTNKPTTTTTTTKEKPTTTTTAAVPTAVEKGVILPKLGYSPDNYITITGISVSGQTVTIEITNTRQGTETDQENSYFVYTCYDKKGKELESRQLRFGRLRGNEKYTGKIQLPSGTAELKLTDYKVEFWTEGWH